MTKVVKKDSEKEKTASTSNVAKANAASRKKEPVIGDLSVLQKARQELIVLNLDNARKKLKNTSSIFLKRKEIARILTKMKEKELLNV